MHDIKVGDILLTFAYTRVIAVSRTMHGMPTSLVVEDLLTGEQGALHSPALDAHVTSADHVTATQRVSLTEMAERLVHAGVYPFTVTFIKAKGDTRTLRGRLLAAEPLLGRSLVEDFDVTEGSRQRLVDHRTLKRLLLKGIEYRIR